MSNICRNALEYFIRIPLLFHLLISLIIHIALIIYGEIHDSHSELQYTDIDYKVVTDAARHMVEHRSPYERHTYRYSPLYAFILQPNIYWHKCFGKLLFSIFDIIVAILIQEINWMDLSSGHELTVSYYKDCYKSSYGILLWLYNPLVIIISTRGNGDAISSALVLLTLYYIQEKEYNSSPSRLKFAGFLFGLAIHLRLYPIIFSLPFYCRLSDANNKSLFPPNGSQVVFVISTIVSFVALNQICYYFYGWEYYSEANFYHIFREDVRHNFSLSFLMQYLNSEEIVTTTEKILINLPIIIILFYTSLKFGFYSNTLPFCIFLQTFCFVTYNSVVTSQYFVWYLALLPLCIGNFEILPNRVVAAYVTLWLLGQALWLSPAYLLEFKTYNTFDCIGIQSVIFFSINIYLIQRFICHFQF